MSLLAAIAGSIGGARITLAATYSVSDSGSGLPIVASFSLESDGDIVGVGGIGGGDLGDWIVPRSSAGATYDVEFHVNSGETPNGAAMDTWLSLGSTRTIDFSTAGAGAESHTADVRVRIRNTSGTVLATSVVTLLVVEV